MIMWQMGDQKAIKPIRRRAQVTGWRRCLAPGVVITTARFNS
jgi:hypothetical protein